MLKYIKQIKWDLGDKYGRFLYYNFFIRELPGKFGEILRYSIISKYFAFCGVNLTIYQGVRFRGVHKLTVGDNVHIGVDNFIQASGGITLGNHVLLGPSVKLWSVNHASNNLNKPIFEQGYNYDPIIVGDGVWIGANAFIMPGVEIPDGCIVSAGSVVGKKKYPQYSIIAGNPARVIGNRKG